MIYSGEKFYGNIFKGMYLDCGTFKGYTDFCRIIGKYINACMIGTGYVGLVSWNCFADFGNTVYWVDRDIIN